MSHAPKWIVAALLAAAGPAWAQAPDPQRQGEVEWACGGVGADERRALSRVPASANLEIVFVTAQRGAYLSGVDWSLERASGATPVRVGARAEGPICRVSAPPGRYRLEGTLDGVRRSATVTLGPERRRAALAFPDEPWDGIRASEEEKRQAREP